MHFLFYLQGTKITEDLFRKECIVVEAESKRSIQCTFFLQQVATLTLITQTKPRNTTSILAYTLLTITNEESDDIAFSFSNHYSAQFYESNEPLILSTLSLTHNLHREMNEHR